MLLLFPSDLNNQNHFIVALSLTCVGNVASVSDKMMAMIVVEC